jgi:(+)-trans-carveol dehydrogenase
MGKLDGKVAFITGAARGQGRSHAIRLAQEGADIIGVDLCGQVGTVPYAMGTADDMAQTVKEVEATGRRMVGTQADVRDPVGLKTAVDAGVEELGRLDIVCANAGIASLGRTEDLTEEQWGDMIDINLSGVWRTAKVSIPHLEASGGGSIIMTSSIAGIHANPNISHYISAKHGVIGLMKSIAVELAPRWIRVNAVLPTQVDTDMINYDRCYRLFRPDLENPTREDFAVASQATNVLPIPWVEPIDISNAIVFLASDEARYITGVALPVDAGNLLK